MPASETPPHAFVMPDAQLVEAAVAKLIEERPGESEGWYLHEIFRSFAIGAPSFYEAIVKKVLATPDPRRSSRPDTRG